MRVALDAYLTNSKDEIARTLPANLLEGLAGSAGEAWIDEAGVVRMGMWLLESRGEALALVYRAPAPANYQYVAHLEVKDKAWKVKAITFEKLLRRQ